VCFGTTGVVLCNSRDVESIADAGGGLTTGRKDIGGVGGKKGYIYSSSCHLIHILHFLAYRTQNGLAFILHNHEALHE